MENNEKVMACKAPSIEGTLSENRKIIRECLDVSNIILDQIANDNCMNDSDQQISCIVSDLLSQNQDLTILLNTLHKIKSHITGGAD